MAKQIRQLAAILFTDIVGYTAMMQQDEKNAVVVTRRYIEVLRKHVTEHGGEILNDYGDGSLSTFTSATQAVRCALEMQQHLQQEPKVPLRIGLHIGEIFFEDGKVFGDGVNVASRIQSLGVANSILFSSEINSKLKNQQDFNSVSLGRFHFKNVDEQVEVFALSNPGLVVPDRKKMEGKLQPKNQAQKKLVIAGALVVLAMLAFFVYRRFSAPAGFTGEKSIAVLPFEQSGATNIEEYISDGISQDIINNLSRITALEKVIGWFSVRRFRNSTQTVKQIADELGVAAILTGTIQRQQNEIHIIAELIDVNTDKRLWGHDYNYDLKDILTIQTDVAQKIVGALRANITSEEKQGLAKHNTENVEAYRLYRKGRYFWDLRSRASYDSAEAYYKKAIELDPDYALAYAGLADCYTFNQKGLTQQVAIPIAKDYTTKALSLDSTLTEAWTTMAFIYSHYDYEWEKAKILLRRTIAQNPNYAPAHIYYGNIFHFNGNFEEGFQETRKALSIDPLGAVTNYVLGRSYYFARKYDSAIAQLQKTVTLYPNFLNAYAPYGQALTIMKKYPQAFDVFSRLPEGVSDQGNNKYLFQSYLYAAQGDLEKSKSLLEKVSEADRVKCPNAMAQVNMARGDTSAALTFLESSLEAHSIQMLFVKTDPIFDPIRHHERYKAIMRKMHLD